MAHEVKLTSGRGDMQKRLNDRLRNSGDGANPDLTVKHGEGARRTYSNLHHSASQGGLVRRDEDNDQ
jgi:hypothetical protein